MVCVIPLTYLHSQAHSLRGTVTDTFGAPCSFSNVMFQSGTDVPQVVMADERGAFNCRLKAGSYLVKAKLIGYLDTTFQFVMPNHSISDLRITMSQISLGSQTISVFADSRDFAREVLKRAVNTRDELSEEPPTFHYDSYRKMSIKETAPDTAEATMDSLTLELSKRKRPRRTYQNYLSESVSNCYFRAPDDYEEIVSGQKDYSTRRPSENLSVSFNFNYGEKEIARQDPGYDNNFILRSQAGYMDYSIYQRLLYLPAIHEKPILSPIGTGALLSYKPRLVESYFMDSIEVYVLRITPILPGEPLFTGEIHVRSSDWVVTKTRLSLQNSVSPLFSTLDLKQEYNSDGNSVTMVKCDLNYSSKSGLSEFEGNICIANKNFTTIDEEHKFSPLTKVIPDSAYSKSDEFWLLHREDSLTMLEKQYAHHCDSLQNLYISDDYIEEQDSINNHVRWMDVLMYGITWRKRERQSLFFIYPLTMQMNFVGVGGYRHKLGVAWVKEFPNTWQLETKTELDYGFRNEDLRGKIGVGLTYYPLKFVRTSIQLGDYYELVNNYASLSSILNRSNFVRTKTFAIAQRMEVTNGCYAELTFDYSLQQPILGLQQDNWSESVFGDANGPVSFDTYSKSEMRLDLTYRPRQLYALKKGKKIILGSNYPTLKGAIRIGVPHWLGSQVNFGYAEAGAYHEVALARLGQLQWSVNGGGFFNRQNLRIIEHRYFRGSDPFLFSDPLKSFQLLGPTLSTAEMYFRANCFHHFNGLLLSKIPLLHWLKITEAAGAGFLAIPSQKMAHSEVYMGLERVVKIRRELFRFGVYGCTSLSSGQGMRLEWKAGVNFYNSYAKKWQY